jgi:hypothetical protein
MKPWHLVLAAALAAGVVGFIVLGRASSNETKSVATSLTALPSEAARVAASANVSAALPSLEAYRAEHGSYAGASAAALGAYNQALSPTLVVQSASATGYCVEDTVDGATASVTGPAGQVVAAPCT